MLKNRTRGAVLSVLSALALVVAGCAAEPSDTTAEEERAGAATTESTGGDQTTAADGTDDTASYDIEGMEEGGDGDEESYDFGEPADPGEADRTVTVQALDELVFDPGTIEASEGEVITFEVVNDGVLPHDFTLGGEEVQQEHAEEMAEMEGEMQQDEPNAVIVPAGETVSLTWRFSEADDILFGCHQPGHYEAGMVGDLTIS